MKKIIMGLLGFIPLFLFIVVYILNFISEKMISCNEQTGLMNEPTQQYNIIRAIVFILLAAAVLSNLLSIIVYFIYNLKNTYITYDKKVGWGYMLICIGVITMPAYWYKFIYH